MPEKAIFKYVTAYAGATPGLDLSEHTLLFTHVPKTAGTTLDYILRAAARTQKIPFTRALGKLYRQINDVSKRDSLKEFALLPDAILEQRCYISGHLPFGVHSRLSRPYFYITILRDPLPRVISHYLFGLRREEWSEPLMQVIEKRLLADNLQTRQIAGQTNLDVPCTADTLKTAISHLQSDYTLVGTSDRFDDTLKLLITLLGWPDIAYGNRQVSSSAPNPELLQEAQEAMQRFYPYDLELYSVARELADRNAEKVLKSSPQGSQRQDRVIVCIPGTPVDGKETAFMSADIFDKVFHPALQTHGGDITFI